MFLNQPPQEGIKHRNPGTDAQTFSHFLKVAFQAFSSDIQTALFVCVGEAQNVGHALVLG